MKSSMQLLSTLNKTLKNQNKNLLKQHFLLNEQLLKVKTVLCKPSTPFKTYSHTNLKQKILINSVATLGLNSQR
ncbi:unnamed protein product [Candidatus Protochlamydia amoebophila UWE25]|uniref:Uncharacterized protein n=1 Tax=Protochlamydia amoebophila (strain UWE25) TaxID=264201 RepID=A0A2P9H9J4_PARUW|nr:unnamed protein product [Candidatus Protochlamydia amoebophila UWE25]